MSLHRRLVALAAAAIPLVAVPTAGADTITVHCVASTSPSCGAAYATIQAAVDAADPGETVLVGTGTFTETVQVAKSLTINGAQAGVDARTRPVLGESIVNGANGGFVVTADDVTIDGFTIKDAGAGFNAGVWLDGAHSGYTILNSVFVHNIMGIFLNASGTHTTRVEQNLFTNDNLPGPASGNGVYGDVGLSNAFVTNNVFSHNENSAMVLGAVASTTHTNVTIEGNEIVDNGGFALLKLNNSAVRNNTFDGVPGSAVYLEQASGVDVTDNTIRNVLRGVRVETLFGFGPSSGVLMHRNIIEAAGEAGLKVAAGAYTGRLDAAGNYWGSPLGPSTGLTEPLAGTPIGGAKILDPDGVVDYILWCLTETCAP